MNGSILEEHLAQAERHVAEGEQVIARQRNVIERIEVTGQDAVQARQLLLYFEQLQAARIADRDRLRAVRKA